MDLLFTNRMECAKQALVLSLKEPALVLTPSLGIRQWLAPSLPDSAKLCSLEEGLFALCTRTPPQQLQRLKTLIWQHLPHFAPSELVSTDVRRLQLAAHLAPLFANYLVYGPEVADLPNWQARLFAHTCPARQYIPKGSCPFASIHVFGFSHLAESHFALLKTFSSQLTFYQLSPCEFFWEDQMSEKLRLRSLAKWQTLGVKLDEQVAADVLLREAHPMLANFGKMSQKMLEMLDCDEAIRHDMAVYPKAVASHPAYSGLIGEEALLTEDTQLTALTALQADMACLRLSKEPLLEPDSSLCLFAASSRREEVERLYAELSSTRPDSAIVMMPDVSLYAPLICAVFERPNADLGYEICDLAAHTQEAGLQALLKLLELAVSKWPRSAVFSLLDMPCVRNKLSFTDAEVRVFFDHCEKANIRWGWDDATRSSCWTKGLAQIELAAAQLPRVLDFVSFVTALHADLEDLCSLQADGETWRLQLEALSDKYCEAPSAVKLPDLPGEINLTLVSNLLADATEKTVLRVEKGPLTISFCSLLPMRAIPADTIWLLGMDEPSFIRQSSKSAFDLLAGKALIYKPKPQELDRTLFLEALLSARKRLIFSYVSQDAEQNPIALAPLVQELAAVSPLYKLQTLAQATKAWKPTPQPPPVSTESAIDIATISLALRNPLKLYFNKALAIEISETAISTDDEALLMRRKDAAILQRRALTEDMASLLARAKGKGEVPEGCFSEVAVRRVQEGSSTLLENFQRLGLEPGELFSVDFVQGVSQISQVRSRQYTAPAIPCNGELITGRIQNLSRRGLVIFGKKDPGTILKNLAEIILSHFLPDAILPEKGAIFLDDGKELRLATQANIHLPQLLAHARRCQSEPSTLLPEWLGPLLEQDQQKLEDAIVSSLVEAPERFFNKEAKWALAKPPQAAVVMRQWAETARELFSAAAEANV